MIRCKDIAVMVGVSRQAVTAVLNKYTGLRQDSENHGE